MWRQRIAVLDSFISMSCPRLSIPGIPESPSYVQQSSRVQAVNPPMTEYPRLHPLYRGYIPDVRRQDAYARSFQRAYPQGQQMSNEIYPSRIHPPEWTRQEWVRSQEEKAPWPAARTEEALRWREFHDARYQRGDNLPSTHAPPPLPPPPPFRSESRGMPLTPQPSVSPEDPLNWSWWKKHAVLAALIPGCLLSDWTLTWGTTVFELQAPEWYVRRPRLTDVTCFHVLTCETGT